MTPQQKSGYIAGLTAAATSFVAQVIYWHFHHHFMSWLILGVTVIITVMVWSFVDERRNRG